jgi:hypothetical protein
VRYDLYIYIYIYIFIYICVVKRLRVNGTVSRPICLKKENESFIQFHWAVDHTIITTLRDSSVGNIEGTLKLTDIHLLRTIRIQ